MSDSVPTKKGKASSSKDAGAATAAAAADAATSASSCVAAAAPPSGGGGGGSASADALLDLLASKIDLLEGSSSGATDDSSLTPVEASAVTAKFSALQTQLDSEAAEGKAPADQLAMLLDLYRSEVQSRMILARQLSDTKEKLVRAGNQKRSLEQLCRELQNRNKIMSGDLKALSHEQNKQHLDMKQKFEVNLKDIQTQLNRHSEERLAQQKENDKSVTRTAWPRARKAERGVPPVAAQMAHSNGITDAHVVWLCGTLFLLYSGCARIWRSCSSSIR